jgi:hypothetical protein
MSRFKHDVFSSVVLKRMLGDKYAQFEKEYDNSTHVKVRWFPTSADWTMFHRNHRPTMSEFQKFWGLKSKAGVMYRIATMYFLEEI